MPDVFTKAKRSDVMSRIRSRGNKATELALVWVFRAHGITGWRRQVVIRGRAALLRGPEITAAQQRRPAFLVRPDFVFPRLRLAVFVDGCFWHGCPRHETKPRNNAAFWRRKFAANKARDRLVTRTLRQNGWRVLRIWEHALVRKNEPRLVARLQRALACERKVETPQPGPPVTEP
jgi:DNA mismatch endonuclease, patch repair protein